MALVGMIAADWLIRHWDEVVLVDHTSSWISLLSRTDLIHSARAEGLRFHKLHKPVLWLVGRVDEWKIHLHNSQTFAEDVGLDLKRLTWKIGVGEMAIGENCVT